MPVPRGHTSVLWELRDGNLTAAEAMVILFLESRKHMGIRGNLGDVKSLCVKETWCWNVA